MIESMILLKAPAKVNLWLKIKGKRADGFHELETVMEPLGLGDEIGMERREGGIECECEGGGADVGSGPSNLAWRAAAVYLDFLKKKRGEEGGVFIRLRKLVPSGAGLGGGSSDAASVLMGMQELYGGVAEERELVQMAGGLGSDVPFFLLGGGGICRGRGELIERRAGEWKGSVLLVKPPFPVSTPWAYGRYAEMIAVGELSRDEREGEIFRNDLEGAVFSKYLILRELKEWLARRKGAEGAMLCGSGSTVWGAFGEREAALAAQGEAAKVFGESFWSCVTEISF